MPQEISLEALDLAALIRDGDHIVWGQGAGEPATLVEKLLEQRHRIGHAHVFLGGVRSSASTPTYSLSAVSARSAACAASRATACCESCHVTFRRFLAFSNKTSFAPTLFSCN
jgi:acyl-CoA hydrolase